MKNLQKQFCAIKLNTFCLLIIHFLGVSMDVFLYENSFIGFIFSMKRTIVYFIALEKFLVARSHMILPQEKESH